MFLRLLLPIALLFPTIALVVEATSLREYRGTWGRELIALLFSIVAYFVVWFVADALVGSITGSGAAGLILGTLVALLSLRPALKLGFRLTGVRPVGGHAAGAH